MKTLSVDPGDKRIGLAVSDPSGTIARPLTTLRHASRTQDAERIAALAAEHRVQRIVVGVPLDEDGQLGPQARKSQRLAEAIRDVSGIAVELWDESLTTLDAAQARRGRSRGRKGGESLDAVAAAVLLQGYLDAH